MVKKYIHRSIESTLRKAAGQFPALIVTGPRQAGKTTLLKHLFSKTHKYASLDDPDLRLMAANEPKLFLANYPPPVIIDEIQYAPDLFPLLKIAIDSNRSKKGQFLLTGSQSFPLMSGISESLAGRIGIFTLLSFSFKERMKIKDCSGIDALKGMILNGGFPETVVDKAVDTKSWFASYLQTYLERDVRQVRQINDLMDFQRFLELLASRNGQVLQLSELSRDLGVAVNTVKGWISVLAASYQVVLIKPFYKNKGKRVVKSPKIYFLDTGFLCYLSGLSYKEQIFKGPLAGQLLETAVIGEIIRNFHNQGEIPRVFWWRTSHGEEVDFIAEYGQKITPIEVKMTSKTNTSLTSGLFSFSKLFADEIDRSVLVNLSDKKLFLGNKTSALPFWQFIKEKS